MDKTPILTNGRRLALQRSPDHGGMHGNYGVAVMIASLIRLRRDPTEASRKENSMKASTPRRHHWQRTLLYVAAYCLLVGGIDTVIAWDQLSVDRFPAIVLMMSLLLLGGLTLGFVDRCIHRWVKRSH
jgi:hypothetical protein